MYKQHISKIEINPQQMKAILLVGGFGTRLRPLTFHTPKPMIPFANKPVLEHIISSLASVGVVEVVLAVGYKPDILHDFSQDMESRHNIKVTCVMETVPMGTGGAMKNCQEIIEKDNPSGLFFACNADIIASYPFQEMIDMMNDLRANEHTKDAEGIISLISVDDPTKYGVVLYDKTGKVTEFLEKPKNPPSNKINAGMYLLSTKIFERMDVFTHSNTR